MRKYRPLIESIPREQLDGLRYMTDYAKQHNLVGPNGNVLVEYKWVSKIGEKYNSYEGGVVSSRVSDFDRALKCDSCGRSIVHAYFVYNPHKKDTKVYGSDHVNEALGYSKKLTKKQLDNIAFQFKKLGEELKYEKDVILKGKGGIKYTYQDIRLSIFERNHKTIGKIDLYFNEKEKGGIIYPSGWTDPVKMMALGELGYEKFEFDGFIKLRDFLTSKKVPEI